MPGSGWKCLGVAGSGLGGLGGRPGSSVGHRALVGLALLGGQLLGLEDGGLAWGKERDNGACGKGCWGARASGNGGWEWGG